MHVIIILPLIAIVYMQVSTLDAAQTGSVALEGLDPRGLDEVLKIEMNIKTRFAIGSQMAEARLVQDLASKVKNIVVSSHPFLKIPFFSNYVC